MIASMIAAMIHRTRTIRRLRRPAVRVLLALAAVACLRAAPAAQAPAPAEAPFTPLFDGRSLAGWVEMGPPGAFAAADGLLRIAAPQNHPSWLRTAREYENFVLRLEYMVTGWCESGIVLHAPLHGDLKQTGLRLHLRHDRSAATVRAAGAIYDLVPPLALANKGAKEWNTLEIRMDWPSLQVTLNDVRVQDLTLDGTEPLRARGRRGYIGFEDMGFEVQYRNVAIRELPATDRPWTRLFNGKDLTGWTTQGVAKWTVEEGTLAGSAGDGFLFTEQAFSAFEFQTYFRASRHANGGVNYRKTEGSNGQEIQIYNVPGSTYPTGSIYGRVPADGPLPCRDEEWCLLRLVSDGGYTGVWVNGWKVAESWEMARPDTGRVGFQNHSQGRIEYREPRIRPLRGR